MVSTSLNSHHDPVGCFDSHLLHEHSTPIGGEPGGVQFGQVNTCGANAVGLPSPTDRVTGRPCRLADDGTALYRVQEVSEQ